eukprot:11302-Heterococcus_DN1.PRE.9
MQLQMLSAALQLDVFVHNQHTPDLYITGSAPHQSRTPALCASRASVCVVDANASIKPDPAASHSQLPATVQHPVRPVHIQLVQPAHLLLQQPS